MNGFDTCSFLGFFITPVYYTIAKVKGVDLSMTSMKRKVVVILIGRLVVGILVNIAITNGLIFIPVSKAILIFSLNPLFWAILAAIFLKEHLSYVSIGSTLGALWGIYLLMQNKPHDAKDESHELLGYILVFTSAWLFGMQLVFLRALNLYKLNVLISPFYFGMSTNIQTIILIWWYSDLLHFEQYPENFFYLWIIGISGWSLQICLILANQYGMASRMAPIAYLENIFTLLADLWLFEYKFIMTDILGMLVIVIWLAIPITIQMLNKKK